MPTQKPSGVWSRSSQPMAFAIVASICSAGVSSARGAETSITLGDDQRRRIIAQRVLRARRRQSLRYAAPMPEHAAPPFRPFAMALKRPLVLALLVSLSACAAVPTAVGERLRLTSTEIRDYVERVFREQNRVADA